MSVRFLCFLQFSVLNIANRAGEGFLPAGQRELVYSGAKSFGKGTHGRIGYIKFI